MAFAWIRKSSEKFKKNLNHKKSGAARRSLRLESLEERCLLAIGVSGAPAPLPAAVIHVANERFVEQLYINLLERNAEPAAISSWSTWLDNAGSRSQLEQSIAGSSEFFSVQVQKLYSRFLYRQPGGSELSNAVNFLSQGGTVDQLKVQVLGSDEYFQFRAGRGVNTLPSALFHDLLLRKIDAASDVAFRAALQQGVSDTAIAQQIVLSPEYQRLEVQEIYERFLLRDPDSVGLKQAVTALGQGLDPVQVEVSIAASGEAYGLEAGQSTPRAADTMWYTRLVSKLYSQFLGRSPTAAENGDWVARFKDAASMGRSPASVYFELLNSAEALGSIVARWHALYLDDATLLADLKSLAGVIAEAGALKNGADFSNILAQIIGSDGFYSLAGGTDAGFAARVYATVLDRAITSQEAADAIIQLGNASRAAFAHVIINSDEGVQTQVARWYQAFLGRSQSVTELKASAQIGFWVRRIEEYGDLNAVLAEMLSSHEYQGFRSDLFASPQAAWSEAPGPFVQQVTAQRGSKATFHDGRPLVATSYFYWYNAAAQADSLRNVGLLNDHPPTQDGFHFLNIDWHKQQFRDMSAAGIDVALPVYWGSPFSDPLTNPDTLKAPNSEFYAFSDPGLRRLVAAREQLVNDGKPAPLLGMFYDTTTLLPSANPKNYSVDLTTPGGKRWFYETIRNFFSHIPASSWATIDGKPMVFLYHPSLARSLDENVFAAVRGMFKKDFGVDLFIVNASEELTPAVRSPATIAPWIDQFQNATQSATLASLLGTDEFYADAGSSTEGFIRRLYDKLLFRQPTTQELVNWSSTLAASDRTTAVASFILSDEVVRMQVAGWYRQYFRRASSVQTIAAGTEVVPWASRLAAGEDTGVVLADFLSSNEFYGASGGSNGALVENLYQRFLLRASDTQGKATWLQKINDLGRSAAIRQFLGTYEARRALVSTWFSYYLGQFYCGRADMEFAWGGAVAPTIRDVAAIGPGFDNSGHGNPQPLVVPRDAGNRYRQAWESLLAMSARPWLVHVETWNELFEATDIAESKEYGRKYIDLTRQYVNRFHAGSP